MEYKTYKKGYLLGADGCYHKVTDEIWFDYMRSVWREEAAIRRDRQLVADKKTSGKKTAEDNEDWKSFPKVVSFDSVVEARGDQILPKTISAEDEAVSADVRTLLYTNMYKALEALDPEEIFLLEKLYLDEERMSIREFAARYREPRTTVQYRRTKALNKLRGLMEKGKGFSNDLVL